MEACWPSGVALRGEASNHPVLRWLKTVVVSDREKARVIASGGDREDVPEAPGRVAAGRRCGSVVNLQTASESGVLETPPRSAWRVPEYWPGGVRRRGGVSPVCGSCTEREKASVDTATGVAVP